MSSTDSIEIFLVTAPGLEAALCAEAAEKGFAEPRVIEGGVVLSGSWVEVWRANLELRGVTRVLARIASFRAMHLAQLDKRARKVEWGTFLRAEVPVRVEAACKRSRIYHAGAAAQRVATAIAEELGAPIAEDAELRVMVRIDDDMVTISLDTSGESLHKRGHKEAVNRAPMRETMAALFLRQCGYKGDEPVLDPMCGSGTFVIEAAEIAAGLQPGRSRSFAFEGLQGFDAAAWAAMKAAGGMKPTDMRFFGSDRDAGAIEMSRANAVRSGVEGITSFAQVDIADLTPPDGPPGLVIANPPYGLRIGDRRDVQGLYAALGKVLKSRFKGWRVGIITTEAGLAKQTTLPFLPPGAPVLHGGTRVNLFQTGAL